MEQKATALTATTVAAQELPTQDTQYIKPNLRILYLNNKIKARNNANSVKNTNISTSTKRKNSYIVNVSDQVQTGELLGHMGNTGHSFGQHLHFELHNGEWNFEKTNAVNPLQYLVR